MLRLKRDGSAVAMPSSERPFHEPGAGDGSTTLLHLAADVLIMIIAMAESAVLPFVCRRLRDVVAKGRVTGRVATPCLLEEVEVTSQYLFADCELWARRAWLSEDGLMRALLSAPWWLGPHVVEQACALLEQLPLQARLVVLAPCYSGLDRRLHDVALAALAQMNGEQLALNAQLLAQCAVKASELLGSMARLDEADASTFYFSLRCWNPELAQQFLASVSDECRYRVQKSLRLFDLLGEHAVVMRANANKSEELKKAGTVVVEALNRLLQECGGVFLPGAVHALPVVSCPKCGVLDEKRAPMYCVLNDSQGGSVTAVLWNNDERVVVQEVGLNVMAQMTRDWQSRAEPFACRLFASQLCARASGGEYVAVTRVHPERETFAERSRAAGVRRLPLPWRPNVPQFEKPLFVRTAVAATVFSVMFQLNDFHNDNRGVSDRGEFALHEVFDLLAPKKTKFGIAREHSVTLVIAGNVLTEARVDVDEFADLCVAAQRAVSCSSLLPFLLGRLGNTPDVMKWAKAPRMCEKTLLHLVQTNEARYATRFNDIVH